LGAEEPERKEAKNNHNNDDSLVSKTTLTHAAMVRDTGSNHFRLDGKILLHPRVEAVHILDRILHDDDWSFLVARHLLFVSLFQDSDEEMATTLIVKTLT
jgi:hypothetical protein